MRPARTQLAQRLQHVRRDGAAVGWAYALLVYGLQPCSDAHPVCSKPVYARHTEYQTAVFGTQAKQRVVRVSRTHRRAACRRRRAPSVQP